MEFKPGDRVIYIGPIEKGRGKLATVKSKVFSSSCIYDITFDDGSLNIPGAQKRIFSTSLILAEDPQISVDVSEFL